MVVHFDSDSAEIRAAAMQTLYGAALDLRGAHLTAIRVIGYADASGRRAHNQQLSQRRAAAVADQLVKLGVHAQVTEVTGSGEVTGNGQRTAKENRRVEIVFERVEIADTAATPVPTATAPPHGPAPAMTALPAPLAIPTAPPSLDMAADNNAPSRLRSVAKTAIKRNLLLAGPAWFPPVVA